MKIRSILPIALLLFSLLNAQSESVSADSTGNDYDLMQPKHLSRSAEIIIAAKELGTHVTNNRFGMGYLCDLDRNLNFTGHGVTIKMIDQSLGFSISFAQYEPNDVTPQFPAEMATEYQENLPFQKSGRLELLSPATKQATVDFNLQLTLLKNNHDCFYFTVGLGGVYVTKKRTSRDYIIQSVYNGSHYYKFSYTGEETAVIEKEFNQFISIGAGIDYNLTDNVQVSGFIKLKGVEGTKANYSPLPRVVLSYMF